MTTITSTASVSVEACVSCFQAIDVLGHIRDIYFVKGSDKMICSACLEEAHQAVNAVMERAEIEWDNTHEMEYKACSGCNQEFGSTKGANIATCLHCSPEEVIEESTIRVHREIAEIAWKMAKENGGYMGCLNCGYPSKDYDSCLCDKCSTVLVDATTPDMYSTEPEWGSI